MIFGGGRIGLPLARRLEAVGPLQRDGAWSATSTAPGTIAEQLRRATVLHEEGLGKDALLAHGVDRAGAFVASAGDDRANLLAALNAKQLGAGLAWPSSPARSTRRSSTPCTSTPASRRAW